MKLVYLTKWSFDHSTMVIGELMTPHGMKPPPSRLLTDFHWTDTYHKNILLSPQALNSYSELTKPGQLVTFEHGNSSEMSP